MQGDFQLVIVHEGDVVVTVDGTRHPLPSRHAALLKPGHREHFAFSRTGETHHTWCAVPPQRVDPALAVELRAAPFSLPLTPRMLALVEMGLSTRISDSPLIAALIDRLGDAFLYEYLTEAVVGGEEATLLPIPVRRAKERIELDFAGPVSVAALARAACCTPNHLTRLFRRHLGVTPARYLWRTRVQRGVEMLRQTGLSISEIAYRTGFQTPFHFSRLVKEQHGMAPKELRARTWNPIREGGRVREAG